MNKNFRQGLPETPGVYLFKDKNKKTIYVGKAINLKKRVSSYFQKNLATEKTKALVGQTHSVETIKVASELEALLLEANLIKKFQPFYNSQLKDDKDYLYIIFTKDPYPAVLTARKSQLQKAKTYFGPFTSAHAARETLKIVRRIFPFRTNCKPGSSRACLYYHLGLCPGVCVGKISKREYSKILNRLKNFLEGKNKQVVLQLQKEMAVYAKNREFEKAATVKRKIEAISKTTQRFEEVEKYLTGPDVLDSTYLKQAEALQKILKIPVQLKRIECYDISNISGTNPTGSMVVLENGQINKDEYRRFKIRTVKGINDPAMMSEVLTRRFKNSWTLPDLIVVDGGKTQLGAALNVLQESNLEIPVIGLAKKLEEIHLPAEKKAMRLPANDPAIYILQRIRDEAHRFAIGYHRLLRSKAFLG